LLCQCGLNLTAKDAKDYRQKTATAVLLILRPAAETVPTVMKRKRDLYNNCPVVEHTLVPINLNTIIRTPLELCAHETQQKYSIVTTLVLIAQTWNLHWSLLTTRTFYNKYRSERIHYVYTCH